MKTSHEHFQAGVRFLENEQYVEVEHCFREAIRLKLDYDEAIAEYQAALEIEADNFSACFNLSRAYQSCKAWDWAAIYARRAVALDPVSVKAHRSLGRSLSMTAHLQEAVSELREAVRLDPNDAYCHAALGRVLVRNWEFGEGLGKSLQAVRMRPWQPSLWKHGTFTFAYAFFHWFFRLPKPSWLGISRYNQAYERI